MQEPQTEEELRACLAEARDTNQRLNREKQKLEAREAERNKVAAESYSYGLGYNAGRKADQDYRIKFYEKKLADYKAGTRQELRELRAWKASAMQVFMELDLQNIGKEMDLTIGSNIAEHILPFVKAAQQRAES